MSDRRFMFCFDCLLPTIYSARPSEPSRNRHLPSAQHPPRIRLTAPPTRFQRPRRPVVTPSVGREDGVVDVLGGLAALEPGVAAEPRSGAGGRAELAGR